MGTTLELDKQENESWYDWMIRIANMNQLLQEIDDHYNWEIEHGALERTAVIHALSEWDCLPPGYNVNNCLPPDFP
jgi:hypothetical protein